MKIFEHYGQEPKPGDVGLEVEVEYKPGAELNFAPGGPWKSTEDNSIGHGLEYITRAPLAVGPMLFGKVKHLTDAIDKSKVEEGSVRAGVHVHVNVQQLTALQVWTACLAYWLVENPLVLYCGQHRMYNHFCLRIKQAQAMLGLCYSDLDSKSTPFKTFQENSAKYSSLNLATVSRLGTLEVRTMRATLDPNLITEWAEVCHHLIHKSATTFESPEDLFDYYLSTHKDEFLNRVLPSYFTTKIKNLPNYVGLSQDNKKILAPLAYYHEDWKAWHERAINNSKALLEKKTKYTNTASTNTWNTQPIIDEVFDELD